MDEGMDKRVENEWMNEQINDRKLIKRITSERINARKENNEWSLKWLEQEKRRMKKHQEMNK